ncbi:MAG: SDR family oxidoreductase [Phycisphaerales bacterium]|nr:SDR family oxidoreductase [Phycisphaerales bacterium]
MTARPVALITGGARRVGRATALELARAGLDLIVTAHRSIGEGESLIREAASLGAATTLIQLDLADSDAVSAAASRLATTLPRLDVLVHNASTYEPSPLDRISAERIARDYRTNALAPLLLSAHLAPLLSRSALPGGGAIVAMCDIHALGEHGLPRPGFASYAMSKAALAEMVRSLARDLAPSVRVNAVAPGVVAWPEHAPESDAAMQKAYLSRVPLARAGTPDDAARAVRWLALDATYITGEIIRLDGGRSLR